MIAFIDAHREVHGVEPICRVLPIAPSTYHEQAARGRDPDRAPARQQRDVVLCQDIRRVFEENFGVSTACGRSGARCSERAPELRAAP